MVVTWSHNTHKLILRNLKKDFGRYFLEGDDFRQNKEFLKVALRLFCICGQTLNMSKYFEEKLSS